MNVGEILVTMLPEHVLLAGIVALGVLDSLPRARLSGFADAEHGGGSDVNWLGGMGGKLAVVFLLGQAGDDEQRLDPEDDNAPLPLESLLDDELKATLRELLAQLPDDARQLLHATYFEGKTLKDAGEGLGISKAWASRLHARSLDQLARALKRAKVAE